MRASLQRASSWAKLIAVTGSAQVAVQAIGFLSGILVIRLLPTHEYALYTLANTMLGTMTLLADGGISTGVMAQGGKVWQDKEKLGAVLATGLYLRKKFAVFSLIVATPILFYLLRKHDASWLMSTLIALSLIPAFVTALSGTLLEIPLKLHQDIVPLQKIQVGANIGRLLLLGLTLFVYPFAAVAILSTGVSQIWSNWRLCRLVVNSVDGRQQIDRNNISEILGVTKRIMPGAVYYCISGQIGIWVLSFFGTTETVAHVGALYRLSLLFNLVGSLFLILVVPRFSRLPENGKILLSRFFQIETFLFLVNSILIIIIWFFSDLILLIFGENYTKLEGELLILVALSAIGIMSSSAYHLSACRGGVVNPFLNVSILLSVQISSLFLFDIATVAGALIYSLLYVAVEFLIRFGYCIVFFKK